MFGFLKDKLKGALKKFSSEVEEEAEVEEEVTETLPVDDEMVEAAPVAEAQEPVEEVPVEKPESKALPADPVLVPVVEKVEEPEPKELVKAVEPELVEETISVEAEDEPPVEESEPAPEIVPEVKKKGLFSWRKKAESEEVVKPIPEAKVEEKPQGKPKEEGFFSRMTKVSLSEEKFEELFWELEVVLLENNVAVEVIERIKEDLKVALSGEKVSRKGVEGVIKETLHDTLSDILSVEPFDLLALADQKQPLVIAMIGVNGSGKTTTLAKLIKYFQDAQKSVVVAAADTFRAAAIQQLEEHTVRLGVKLIKHDYNADPAAVAFDAVKHARAKGIDVVLIDSAGRLHSNDNLMNELKKLIRINEPDVKLFVGEAITGNDCVEQAKLFDEAVGIDGIILAKADVDEKGGAAISASFVTKRPVLFLGTGQGYDDLKPFDPAAVLSGLGL